MHILRRTFFSKELQKNFKFFLRRNIECTPSPEECRLLCWCSWDSCTPWRMPFALLVQRRPLHPLMFVPNRSLEWVLRVLWELTSALWKFLKKNFGTLRQTSCKYSTSECSEKVHYREMEVVFLGLKVSVSAMQPCPYFFISLPLLRE